MGTVVLDVEEVGEAMKALTDRIDSLNWELNNEALKEDPGVLSIERLKEIKRRLDKSKSAHEKIYQSTGA